MAVAAVLFGTSGSAARLGAPDLDPAVVAAWRVLIGGAVLLVVSCLLGCSPWRYRVRVHQLLLGSGTVAGFQLAFFSAVERLGVAQATVLAIVTAPIAAALTDHARGRAALTARWSLGVLIAGVGVTLMSNGSWTLDPVGVSLSVTAGCCFLVYASVLRTLRTDRPDIAAVATVFGGATPLALVGLLFARGRAPDTMSATMTVLYLGATATAIAYLLWTYALRHLSVRDTVLITMVEPVTATILASVVLDDPMSAITIAGIAAVSAGICHRLLHRRTPDKSSR